MSKLQDSVRKKSENKSKFADVIFLSCSHLSRNMVVKRPFLECSSLPMDLIEILSSPNPEDVLEREYQDLKTYSELNEIDVKTKDIVIIKSKENPVYISSSSLQGDINGPKFLPQLVKEKREDFFIKEDNKQVLFLVIHYSMIEDDAELPFEKAERILNNWAKKANKSLKDFAKAFNVTPCEIQIKLYNELEDLHNDPLIYFHRKNNPGKDLFADDASLVLPTVLFDCSPLNFHENYIHCDREDGYPDFTVFYTTIEDKSEVDSTLLRQISKSLGNGQSVFRIGGHWSSLRTILSTCSRFAVRYMIQKESGMDLFDTFHKESLHTSATLSHSKAGHISISQRNYSPGSSIPIGIVRDLTAEFEPVGNQNAFYNVIKELCESVNICNDGPTRSIRHSYEHVRSEWRSQSLSVAKSIVYERNGDFVKLTRESIKVSDFFIDTVKQVLEKEWHEHENLIEQFNDGTYKKDHPINRDIKYPRVVKGIELDHNEYRLFYDKYSEICLAIYSDDDEKGSGAASASNKPHHSLAEQKSELELFERRGVNFDLLHNMRVYGRLSIALDKVKAVLEELRDNENNSKVYDVVCRCLMLKLSDTKPGNKVV